MSLSRHLVLALTISIFPILAAGLKCYTCQSTETQVSGVRAFGGNFCLEPDNDTPAKTCAASQTCWLEFISFTYTQGGRNYKRDDKQFGCHAPIPGVGKKGCKDSSNADATAMANALLGSSGSSNATMREIDIDQGGTTTTTTGSSSTGNPAPPPSGPPTITNATARACQCSTDLCNTAELGSPSSGEIRLPVGPFWIILSACHFCMSEQ